jgi:hypothetical protein
MLDPTPREPTADGRPAFGTYTGRCADVDLRLGERGVSRRRQYVSRKRWHWFSAFDGTTVVGGALVDAGFFATAFLWVFDREAGAMLVDEDVVVPSPLLWVTTHPTVGTLARISVPGYRLTLVRTGRTLTVEGSFGDADLDLALTTDDEAAITAVCPVPEREHGVNVTQKEVGLAATGRITVDRERTLDGTGLVDYTHGLLARETEWEWAIGSCTAADGTSVGFNLVDGFNDGLENVVWVDGVPRSVGAASFDAGDESDTGSSDADDWQVTTECGTLDLALSVEGTREEDLDLGVVRSQYRQPLGRWEGIVDGFDVEGVGVAEEHLARW